MKMLRTVILFNLALLSSLLLFGCFTSTSNYEHESTQEPESANVYRFCSPLRLSEEEKAGGMYLSCTQEMGNFYSDKVGFHSAEDWCVFSKGEGNQSYEHDVYAIGIGKVAHIDNTTGYGTMVIIEHRLTPDGKQLLFNITAWDNSFGGEHGSYQAESAVKIIYSVYYHLENVCIKEEEWVNENTLVGQITKPVGLEPHLHFEIRNPNPEGKEPAEHSSTWTMVNPINNWCYYKDEEEKVHYNGYYLHLQRMLDSGFRDPSDFLEANESITAGDQVAEEVKQVPIVEGTSEMQDNPIENGTFIISLNPNKAEIDDFSRIAFSSEAYLKTRVNGGYRLTCSVLECVTISFDEYTRITKGETIQTAAGEIGHAQDASEYSDIGCFSDEAVVFNEGRYFINKIPDVKQPELLRDPYYEIWTNIETEGYPIISGAQQCEYFISDETMVTLFGYSNAITMRFCDFLINGNLETGDAFWPYTFYATIQNNEIIQLEEIDGPIDE